MSTGSSQDRGTNDGEAMPAVVALVVTLGLLRPITLFPFPKKPLGELAKRVKGFLVVEMNAGQMIEDVQLAVGCNIPVKHFGRMGGIIPSPTEVVEALEQKLIGG